MQDAQDQPAQTLETPATKKRVPGWAAAAGAVVFLLGAGAFIFWFLGGSFAGTSDLIPDPARADRGGNGRGNWRQVNADGVKPLPNNQGHYVLAGQAIMNILPPPPGKKRDTRYEFRYDSRALLTPEQYHLVRGVRQVDAWAKALNVTPDQLNQLRKLGPIPMAISKADQDRLIAAWTDYDKAAAKGDPEQKLVAALKDAAAKALPATKAQATARIAEFTRILTPAQARELTKLGAGEKVTPLVPQTHQAATTRPTTRQAPATRPA
jgi:Spy/CpxP family protein refolding chaperone